MKKLPMHSPDLTQQNLEKIRAAFPNCVTEARDAQGNLKLAVDFDLLKQELADSIVEGPQERYRLDWPGKREAMLTANAPIAKTLRPARDESVNFDATENLFIEGDNLDALKLLQESYLGKVKMIYIDPPYNTGSDFIYNDDFSASTEDFLIRSNQTDEMGNRFNANPESNGRFHSDWLSMMLPRLKLARNLLRDDGIIFISIDDNEQAVLKKLCDEIFGESNFLNCIAVKTSESSGVKMAHISSRLPKIKEYILVYKKENVSLKDIRIPKEKWDDEYSSLMLGISLEEWEKIQNIISNLERTESEISYVKKILDNAEYTTLSRYFREHSISNKKTQENFKFDNSWRIFQTVSMGGGTTDAINRARESDLNHIFFPYITTNNQLYIIKGDYDLNARKPRIQVLFAKDYLTYHPGDFWFDIKTTGLGNEGQVIFKSGKKPLALIERLIHLSTGDGDIVLDFFAGSGTIGEAVLKTNCKEPINRKFILVQLPEDINLSLGKATDTNSRKAILDTIKFLNKINKPHFITEISKERIRRAGKQILEGECHEDWNKDVGFRVLKVDTSNMKDVYYNPNELSQADLIDSVDHIKDDRSSEDLLFQVLLDWGVDLTLPIRRENIQGKEVFIVDQNALVACFERGVTEELVTELAQQQPLRMVFRDNGFASDSIKINATQIFKQRSPMTDVKSI